MLGERITVTAVRNPYEEIAEEIYKTQINLRKNSEPFRKTSKPVIIAMVGLIGSGKSAVARELARKFNAVIVELDAIRVVLRKRGCDYSQVKNIALRLIGRALNDGYSIVIDGDFADWKKRAWLWWYTYGRAKRFYIRTYADPDMVFGQIIKCEPEEFFGGASSTWDDKNKGKVVKLREMWRRTPHHYWWSRKSGGRFTLRKMPFTFVEIDTSTGWKKKVERVAQMINQTLY